MFPQRCLEFGQQKWAFIQSFHQRWVQNRTYRTQVKKITGALWHSSMGTKRRLQGKLPTYYFLFHRLSKKMISFPTSLKSYCHNNIQKSLQELTENYTGHSQKIFEHFLTINQAKLFYRRTCYTTPHSVYEPSIQQYMQSFSAAKFSEKLLIATRFWLAHC